jgi:hypothetical protein
MAVADIRSVLRALADVRDADFYELWVDVIRSWPEPLPEIEFRIYRVADSTDAMVVVAVEGTRPDGIEIAWALSVTAHPNDLLITGSIGARAPDGETSETFHRSEASRDPEHAAGLIRALATEVCGQRGALGPT